jgi:hypothetical protein
MYDCNRETLHHSILKTSDPIFKNNKLKISIKVSNILLYSNK